MSTKNKDSAKKPESESTRPTAYALEVYTKRFDRLLNTLDAGRVMRWHTQPDGLRQTVGEHTFGVMCILLFALNEADWASGVSVAESRRNRAEACIMLIGALLHDSREIFTGDIPAPVCEVCSSDSGFELAQYRAGEQVLTMTPEARDARIIFYADKIEAMMFALKSGRFKAFEYNRDLVRKLFESDNITPRGLLDAFKRLVDTYVNVAELPQDRNG